MNGLLMRLAPEGLALLSNRRLIISSLQGAFLHTQLVLHLQYGCFSFAFGATISTAPTGALASVGSNYKAPTRMCEALDRAHAIPRHFTAVTIPSLRCIPTQLKHASPHIVRSDFAASVPL